MQSRIVIARYRDGQVVFGIVGHLLIHERFQQIGLILVRAGARFARRPFEHRPLEHLLRTLTKRRI